MSRHGQFHKSFAQEFDKWLARGVVLTVSAIVMTLFDLFIHHLNR